VKMEVDYSLLADFLGLLWCHAHHNIKNHNAKKGFKFGHMLVTSNQSELVYEKGVRGIFTEKKDKNFSRTYYHKVSWKIPSEWEIDEPPKDLGEDWDREKDSRLLVSTFRCGKNLAKIVTHFPNMKELIVDGEGKAKEAVKQRYAYLLNIYQNRGVYDEEFGSSFYSGDQDDEEEVEVMEEQGDDGEEEDEEVMDITKDEDAKEDVKMNSENVKEAKEESNGNAENGVELGGECEDDDEEVDDALLDTPDSEPGEEDM